jgi:hypothetical protein
MSALPNYLHILVILIAYMGESFMFIKVLFLDMFENDR